MTMEHRWKTRQPTNLDVDVYKDGARLGTARALDVSAGGMGLACRFGLKINDVVEVQLPEEGHYGYANYLVVHADAERCGLMFLSFSDRHSREQGMAQKGSKGVSA